MLQQFSQATYWDILKFCCVTPTNALVRLALLSLAMLRAATHRHDMPRIASREEDFLHRMGVRWREPRLNGRSARVPRVSQPNAFGGDVESMHLTWFCAPS